MVAHICHPSYYGMYKIGDPSLGQPGYKVRPKLKKKKKTRAKKVGRVAQVVECLPGKDKALSSISSTVKRKGQEEGRKRKKSHKC
jgi:hypothetical protein